MQIQPYLQFNGRCEEALEYYKQKLGATVDMIMRYKECPVPPDPKSVKPGFENKIMHASVRMGGSTLMCCDSPFDDKFGGFALSYVVETEAEADRAFNAFADGGQVRQPLTKTFFSPRFGMVKDRFGVPWMVIVMTAAAEAKA